MFGPEHYISKIDRNANVVDKAPEDVRVACIANIKWAREMVRRLESLDYDVREATIDRIHALMDEDYEKMGFTIEKPKTK